MAATVPDSFHSKARRNTAILESDSKLKDRSKGYRIPRTEKKKTYFSCVTFLCNNVYSAPGFTSTVPQSHSSPASSRRFPQGGATAMVLTELAGLDKQFG